MLTSESLFSVTSQSLASIPSQEIDDPITCRNIGSLIYTLIKLRNDHINLLISVLNNLHPDQDDQVGIFISYVYAKVLKHSSRYYTKSKLDDCVAFLTSSTIVLPSAYFLYFLIKHAPHLISPCSIQYTQAPN